MADDVMRSTAGNSTQAPYLGLSPINGAFHHHARHLPINHNRTASSRQLNGEFKEHQNNHELIKYSYGNNLQINGLPQPTATEMVNIQH
ncbi:hypothetical protein J6590_000258 [Homalodisca vitripennis]|nr:hypothetical protein J6590_000258 [Homalodisca vitripennis]